MANLYLSFLGTNDYLPCTYEHQNRKIENVRFVQEATIRLHCMDWSQNDRVIIFTTPQALNLNWKDDGQINRSSGERIQQFGLETCIKNIKGNFSWNRVDIPDGRNEKEIWNIFLKVFDIVEEEDKIIFDITHAFRSIPLLAIVILNYARIMKNISLSGIYYGALEALGGINEVKKMQPEKRIVPIIDLTAFDQLMEWSVAADRFIKSGDASWVSKIAEHTASTILSETKGNDRSQHTIRNLARNLDKFTKTLATCRGRDISPVVERLKQTLENCQNLTFNNPLNMPLKAIIGKIDSQINMFSNHQIRDGIKAARWCLEHNLVQQSYTILQETLITYFIYKIGEDTENYGNKNLLRTLAGQAIAIIMPYILNNTGKKLPFKEWKSDAQNNKELIEKFISFYKTQPRLVKTYNDLTGYRNDLNHAGHSADPRPAGTFIKKMPGFLDDVESTIT